MRNQRRTRWRTVWQLILFFAVSAIIVRLYLRITDDFRISNITYELPFRQEWQVPVLTEQDKKEVDKILDQKFYYIGKGSQSYVFGSEDDKYVIKFFKFKHLRPSLIVSILPDFYPFDKYKTNTSARKLKKLNSVFTGYKIAYEMLKQESGLMFEQLNPDHCEKWVNVVDKIGLNRKINLGDVVYIIQKKGETLRSILAKQLDQGDVEGAKERIGQIFHLYVNEYAKGIYDRDHGVMHNVGFINGQPAHLDVGKFAKEEKLKDPNFAKRDILLMAAKIEEWIGKHHSKYRDEIVKDMEARLDKIFDDKLTIIK